MFPELKMCNAYHVSNFVAIEALRPHRILQTDVSHTRVEAGSKTSTVTLQVVGGDEKGSLKSETAK
jgi:hypothetical protein